MQKELFSFGLTSLYKVLTVLVSILCVLAIIYTVNTYKEGKIIGSSATNIISVSGKGEVKAVPDIANINITIRESGIVSKEAEEKVSIKTDKFLKEIKTLINEKDIKTESYNVNPKYNYGVNNNYGNPKIEGYEVSQNITLKVTDVKNVAKVLEMITNNGIGEMSGPNYQTDEIGKYTDEARAIAIKDAKENARKLAEQLGVDIVRMTSFSENGDYSPAAYARMEKSLGAAQSVQDFAPQIPTGENTIKSNVTITFEIK